MIKAEDIDWKKMGDLVPSIIQHAHTNDILMLGYMNQEALAQTVQSGNVTFFSRSKKRLWQKGETSGNTLSIQDIKTDCDNDAILIKAIPKGPTCHEGVKSCFLGDTESPLGFLGVLNALIKDRAKELPANSYTTSLFKDGIHRMAQKVGEEGVEVALAAKDSDNDALIGECADLFFHTMVLCRAKDIGLDDICNKLKSRHS